MNVTDILKMSAKPPVYTEGTAFMWTDEHISNYLLETHLNPEMDLASRTKDSIHKTAKWLLNLPSVKNQPDILDLGCGPGLYTEIFAKTGKTVTGVDISKKSIDYADKSAKEKSLNIRYINASYLDLDLGEEQYDLITLIYTDLGVLMPKDRITLLNKVYKALKPGGVFVFDLLKRKEMEKRLSPKSWEAAQQGFWKSTPYLALSESFFYEENDVILYQHTIIDANGVAEIYRFWTHFFEVEDINKMLSVYKYSSLEFRDDILPEGNIWNGKNVIFTVAVK